MNIKIAWLDFLQEIKMKLNGNIQRP